MSSKLEESTHIKIPWLRRLVHSASLDVLGALLIFSVCYYRNFHGTIYMDGEVQFGKPFSELWGYVQQGAYPLGLVSTIGAIFSMLATRLISKQSNSGNIIGLATTVNSGANDYLFGNGSAIITYPITFLTHYLAVKRWAGGEKIRSKDRFYYMIICIAMLVAFCLVYLGAYLFGGITDHKFLLIVATSFGISLGATTSNAFKYQETWISWCIYNVIQLVKNTMQLNLANVVKYVFYLFNATFTLFDWKLNGDKK